MNPLFSAFLTTAASVSPLLTFAALWQIKEWRTDRLREHLRSEGFLRQLFGVSRPLILGFFGCLGFLGYLDGWHTVTLAGYLSASAVQIVLRRHPKPVWTKKAIILVSTALTLTLLTALPYNLQPTTYNLTLPLIPLLQPFFLFVSRLLWSPVDRILKKHIMNKARTLRFEHADLTVIGITGSVGKSTTKELLAHVLRESHPLATPQHVNTEMGVSQWLLKELPKNPETKTIIVEMGAYRTGEIALLCKIMQPTMGVITFIGRQHIALFGSQEALCAAKGELLEALPRDGQAFLNGDSELCGKLKERANCPLTTVGTGGAQDLEAFDIEETSHGIQFRCGETPFFVPLHGTHNVTNILLSIAVAEKLGMSRGHIAEQLKSFRPSMHTFAMRKSGTVIVLDDTHNASAASFSAAVTWAKSQPFEAKTLLTSGLIELGEEQDRIHAELGTLSLGLFNRVVFLNRRSARAFAEGYGRDVEMYSTRSPPVPEDSLLVCVGRMSEEIIEQLLPKRSNEITPASRPSRRRSRLGRAQTDGRAATDSPAERDKGRK